MDEGGKVLNRETPVRRCRTSPSAYTNDFCVSCVPFFFRPPFYFLRLGGLFARIRGERRDGGKNKTKTPTKTTKKKKPYFPGFFLPKKKETPLLTYCTVSPVTCGDGW